MSDHSGLTESASAWAERTGRIHLAKRFAAAGAAQPPRAPSARHGLVYSPTSQKPDSEISFLPGENRAKKIATGIVGAAQVHASELRKGGFRDSAALLTPTYRDGVVPSERDISVLLDHIGKWVRRHSGRKLRYVWRYEFGAARGRGHYHVMLWLPRGLTLPKPDKQGWWVHGATNVKWARSPARYLAKYAAKAAADPDPVFNVKGLRWWGAGGLTRAGRNALLLLTCPRWVCDLAHGLEADVVRRLKQSGWWKIGGFLFRSPWRFLGTGPTGAVRLAWHGHSEDCWMAA